MMTVRFVNAIALAALATAITSGQVVKQSELGKLYGSRWVVLPLPDSRIGPGAIISIKKGQAAWESSLARCGAPADVMKTVPGEGGKVNLVGDAEYGADAVLKIAGIEAGPEFKRVKRTTLSASDHKPEALDRISLGEWINAPGKPLSPTCAKFLTQKDIYIVQEAYQIGRGNFTLYDDSNKKISLAGLQIGPLKIGANAKAKTTTDGTLEFASPMYTAVRRLKLMKDGELRTLGQPGQERAEEKTDVAVRAALCSGSPSVCS